MSGGQASLQTLISSQEEKRDPGQHEGDDGGYEESCRMKAMVWDNLGDERERERGTCPWSHFTSLSQVTRKSYSRSSTESARLAWLWPQLCPHWLRPSRPKPSAALLRACSLRAWLPHGTAEALSRTNAARSPAWRLAHSRTTHPKPGILQAPQNVTCLDPCVTNLRQH